MVQINQAQRELTLKVVYYGPALSGKTTNLQALHDRVAAEVRGRLLTVDTKDDRTLFFDVLPVSFRSGSGLRVKLKLYTVPGQVMHASTRRLVLQGADAVVFVADSQRSLTAANNEAWRSMVEDMRQNGIDPDTCPMVIQFNKRDLPDARSQEELEEIAKKGKEPIYPAVAIRGEGVVETLHGLLALTYRHLDRQYELANKFGLAEDEFLGQLFKHLDLAGSAPVAAGAGTP
jgi:signal recognition particle receptor subunit beta